MFRPACTFHHVPSLGSVALVTKEIHPKLVLWSATFVINGLKRQNHRSAHCAVRHYVFSFQIPIIK